MIPSRTLDRRTFVADLGRGAFALAILGVAGCAPASSTSAASKGSASTAPSAAGTMPAASGAAPTASGSAPEARSPGTGTRAWQRVNLGFVSAYILVRGGEAAVVDTGVEGSEDAIEASLRAIGLDWAAVGHVILTHNHADHAGSASAVLERAAGSAGYAGAADIPGITTPRELTAVNDGDRVFDLLVITASGHTAGSICVLDHARGILVAGDALRTDGGRPALPEARFTDDMDEALASVAKLGALTFETLLVGHGDPIEVRASAMVADLAAQP